MVIGNFEMGIDLQRVIEKNYVQNNSIKYKLYFMVNFIFLKKLRIIFLDVLELSEEF